MALLAPYRSYCSGGVKSQMKSEVECAGTVNREGYLSVYYCAGAVKRKRKSDEKAKGEIAAVIGFPYGGSLKSKPPISSPRRTQTSWRSSPRWKLFASIQFESAVERRTDVDGGMMKLKVFMTLSGLELEAD
ncbi:hypothetical protein BV898_16098 [Hypsibius exemplaris]|uniref:Uncharacterized protein n=1 Tax=Hypsibius exemplaris TaxID=2072580 RepID=A0A9X6NCW9_HYPEX|nr:hypothetical protein BV898_16098 [Hypsibius exemplaris]